jgi:hypothetical protein
MLREKLTIHVAGKNRPDVLSQIETVIASYLGIDDLDEATQRCDTEVSVLFDGKTDLYTAEAYVKIK